MTMVYTCTKQIIKHIICVGLGFNVEGSLNNRKYSVFLSFSCCVLCTGVSCVWGVGPLPCDCVSSCKIKLIKTSISKDYVWGTKSDWECEYCKKPNTA
jgi:hypothetical protein